MDRQLPDGDWSTSGQVNFCSVTEDWLKSGGFETSPTLA